MFKQLAVFAIVVFALALIAPASAPVSVSYVTSESMSPTLDTNDGYVLVPANDVESGDVISFYSPERDAQVTHRAVRVTDGGIVTRGDANPSTDQAAGYPRVDQADVDGRVLTLGNGPLVIPHLGFVLTTLRTYWYLVLAMLVLSVFWSSVGDARRRSRDSVLRSRDVVLPVAIVSVVLAVSLVSVAAVHQTELYTVTQNTSEDPRTLTRGETQTETFTLSVTTSPVTHVVTDTDGMRIRNVTSTGRQPQADGPPPVAGWLPEPLSESATQNVTATIPAQQATGPYATTVHVYTYPATLPGGVIESLHGVHPLLASFVTVLAVISPLYLLYWLVVDTTVPLRGTRQRLGRRFGGLR